MGSVWSFFPGVSGWASRFLKYQKPLSKATKILKPLSKTSKSLEYQNPYRFNRSYMYISVQFGLVWFVREYFQVPKTEPKIKIFALQKPILIGTKPWPTEPRIFQSVFSVSSVFAVIFSDGTFNKLNYFVTISESICFRMRYLRAADSFNFDQWLSKWELLCLCRLIICEVWCHYRCLLYD